MIDWRAVEDAFHAWAVSCSGLAAAYVIWAPTNGNPPAEDYLTLSLSGALRIGQEDETTKTDLNQPAGQEIDQRVTGDREVTLTIESFSVAPNAEQAARAALSAMLTRSRLPSRRALLDDAGITMFRTGQVGWVPDIRSIAFRGRALVECRCYLRESASERTGYIAKVEVVDTKTGDVIIIEE